MIKKITSASNGLIQQIAKLHAAKYRFQEGQFIAEGVRTIDTFLEAGFKPVMVFATEEFLSFQRRLESRSSATILDSRLRGNDKNIISVSSPVMKKLSTANTPSGLLCVFAIPAQPLLESISSGIVFAGMRDPGNVGTLIRTAAAMNKKTAIFIDSVDPWSPKVVQASTGALGWLNVFHLSWDELTHLKKRPPLCALTVSQGKDPATINIKNSLLVVGGEAQGLATDWVEQCEQNITLPMPGNFESLNAGVAGSIALYLSAH